MDRAAGAVIGAAESLAELVPAGLGAAGLVMDPVNGLLSLASSILERVQQSSQCREDFQKLAQYVERLCVFVREAKDKLTTDTSTSKQFLEDVTAALRDAEKLLEECSNYGHVETFLKSDAILRRLKDITVHLKKHLELFHTEINLTTLNLSERQLAQIKQLSSEMTSNHYTMFDALTKQKAEFDRKLAHFEARNEELVKMVMATIDARVAKEDNDEKLKQELMAEIERLRQQHYKHQMDKEADEMNTMQGILHLLTIIERTPEDFICRLSKRVMKNPVFLTSQGRTYEREAIEQHLRKSLTDPETGFPLPLPENFCSIQQLLVPNVDVRERIAKWQDKARKSSRATTHSPSVPSNPPAWSSSAQGPIPGVVPQSMLSHELASVSAQHPMVTAKQCNPSLPPAIAQTSPAFPYVPHNSTLLPSAHSAPAAPIMTSITAVPNAVNPVQLAVPLMPTISDPGTSEPDRMPYGYPCGKLPRSAATAPRANYISQPAPSLPNGLLGAGNRTEQDALPPITQVLVAACTQPLFSHSPTTHQCHQMPISQPLPANPNVSQFWQGQGHGAALQASTNGNSQLSHHSHQQLQRPIFNQPVHYPDQHFKISEPLENRDPRQGGPIPPTHVPRYPDQNFRMIESLENYDARQGVPIPASHIPPIHPTTPPASPPHLAIHNYRPKESNPGSLQHSRLADNYDSTLQTAGTQQRTRADSTTPDHSKQRSRDMSMVFTAAEPYPDADRSPMSPSVMTAACPGPTYKPSTWLPDCAPQYNTQNPLQQPSLYRSEKHNSNEAPFHPSLPVPIDSNPREPSSSHQEHQSASPSPPQNSPLQHIPHLSPDVCSSFGSAEDLTWPLPAEATPVSSNDADETALQSKRASQTASRGNLPAQRSKDMGGIQGWSILPSIPSGESMTGSSAAHYANVHQATFSALKAGLVSSSKEEQCKALTQCLGLRGGLHSAGTHALPKESVGVLLQLDRHLVACLDSTEVKVHSLAAEVLWMLASTLDQAAVVRLCRNTGVNQKLYSHISAPGSYSLLPHISLLASLLAHPAVLQFMTSGEQSNSGSNGERGLTHMFSKFFLYTAFNPLDTERLEELQSILELLNRHSAAADLVSSLLQELEIGVLVEQLVELVRLSFENIHSNEREDLPVATTVALLQLLTSWVSLHSFVEASLSRYAARIPSDMWSHCSPAIAKAAQKLEATLQKPLVAVSSAILPHTSTTPGLLQETQSEPCPVVSHSHTAGHPGAQHTSLPADEEEDTCISGDSLQWSAASPAANDRSAAAASSMRAVGAESAGAAASSSNRPDEVSAPTAVGGSRWAGGTRHTRSCSADGAAPNKALDRMPAAGWRETLGALWTPRFKEKKQTSAPPKSLSARGHLCMFQPAVTKPSRQGMAKSRSELNQANNNVDSAAGTAAGL